MPAFCPSPASFPSPKGLNFLRPSLIHTHKPSPCKQTHLQPLRAALPDVVVVGGGASGLSTAFELAQRGAKVRVLATETRPSASLAAAGMLAPYAEHQSDHLLQLSLHSLQMYPSFVHKLQQITSQDLHYVSRADFLAPYFSQPPSSSSDLLVGDAVQFIEPALGPDVLAVRRFPLDASIDNRRLLSALRAACLALGVTIDNVVVRNLVASPTDSTLTALQTEQGELVSAAHFIVSAGSWTRKLLPMVPIKPIKGQMLSLAPQNTSHQTLNHVLHGSDVYIVPKNDRSEFYVGATVEDVGFDFRNTPAAIKYLLDAAVRLVPDMSDYEIRDMWAGLRPATPDGNPIFGRCAFDNLSVATGFYRNGILLTPVAAKLAAAHALGETDQLKPELLKLMKLFSIQRFYNAEQDISTGKHSEKIAAQKLNPVTNQVTSLNSESSSVSSESSVSEIKLWSIRPDGTSEPVYPPNWKGPKTVQPTLNLDVSTEIEPSPTARQTTTSVPKAGDTAPIFTTVENPENVSGVNDAYEDVMCKRGPGMNDSMSRAMAANRAFGRKRSSIQRDDGPVLSITEEEVQLFDAASNKGYEDMQDIEKTFHENHESVLATRVEEKESKEADITHKSSSRQEQSAENKEPNSDNAVRAGYY